MFAFGDASLRFDLPQSDGSPAVADLDGDGRSEVIVNEKEATYALIYDSDGVVVGKCYAQGTSPRDEYDDIWSIAVGDLDTDPELEVVVGGAEGIAVCDRDGTLLASTEMAMNGGLALAQLDGDPYPEILANNGGAILAFEHDLSPLPGSPLRASGRAFSVADLDGDGIHEILSWTEQNLTITRANGIPLAYHAFEGITTLGGWTRTLAPIVVDVDGDGLAEIVVAEWTRGGLSVIDNPLGGWPSLGADTAWTGLGHHSALRTDECGLHQFGPDDVKNGHNVWNGRPSVPPQCSSALRLDLRDICVESCSGNAHVTTYIQNTGVLPSSADLTLGMWVDGALIATAPVPVIEPELATPVQITVSSEDLSGQIEVRLSGEDSADCIAPLDTWTEPVCP